jgi:hypothetical protein
MKKNKISSQSAFFNRRVLMALAFFLFSAMLAVIAGTQSKGGASTRVKPANIAGATPGSQQPDVVKMFGPVEQNLNLNDLPYIPPNGERDEVRLRRHPFLLSGKTPAVNDTVQKLVRAAISPSMPSPSLGFEGIDSNLSGCGCTPPDTDGDVGSNHYIQTANSSIRIHDKSGNVLAGPITYNTFFAAIGPSNPCGNNQNDGDGIVFYDHLADRWVVSDFAFGTFPGAGPFMQCIGVSKTSDPVAGGWYLYAVQVDPANPTWLGDYPKFGLWPDGYYLTLNEFSNNTTFNGVRVYALDRNSMVNGGSSNAIGFSILPADLGDQYSLVPASFRTGSPPPAGQPEWLMDVNSSATAGTVETQVFVRRFHADFVTPANSTFGVSASHLPDGIITVNGFVDAEDATNGTDIVPNGTATTAQFLDTLGDKLMYPLIYQNLGGVESIYADQTVNNNQNGTGPTAVRWYQFDVTGNTIPATPRQQQSFNNGGDGLWRFMPSMNVDWQGNVAIGYSAASTTINPGIRYAGRLATDPSNNMSQGEAVMTSATGHQTSTGHRWGDYSTVFVDPSDSCTFFHTNEYYSVNATGSWRTKVGTFKFAVCTPQALPSPTPSPSPSPSPIPNPSPTPNPSPSASPTPTPTPSPTPPISAGPVTITATAGIAGPTDYATVQAAFAAINTGTHQGAINVWIMGDTAEAAAAVLNASGTGSAAYTSVLMLPNGTRTVSGNLATPLIDLNGAKNVTIDGYTQLTISNTNTGVVAGTSTIRFINGASNNVVRNSTISGSATAAIGTAGGNVLFSTTTGLGNNYNVIFNNNIGPAGANLPVKCISAAGTTTNANTINTGNVIDGNNIFDFFLATSSVTGVDIRTGNTNGYVSNNRIYQTATRTFTTTVGLRYAGITFSGSTGTGATGNFMNITGNRIGFGAADGTGTTTITGTGNGLQNEVRGIDLQAASSGSTTSVQGNTISGISQTSARLTVTTGLSAFAGIQISTLAGASATGVFDIGNITGNTVGSLDGSSTIVINASSVTASTTPIFGILDISASSNNVSNNKIGAITIQGTGTVTGFRGILSGSTAASTHTINNNTIGGAVAGGAITDSLVGSYSVYGIQTSTAAFSINGNTVRNLNGNSNGAGLVVGAGIVFSTGSSTAINTISRNTVYNLSNTSGAVSNSIYGIDLSFPSLTTTLSAASVVGATNIKVASVTNMVVGNTLTVDFNGVNPEVVTITIIGTTGAGGTGVTFTPALAFAHASAATVALNGALINANLVERNFVHSLSLTSTDNNSQTWGMLMRGAGAATIQNNMIRLGLDSAGNPVTSGFSIIGIRDSAPANVSSYYFNSIYIGGTGVVSTGSNSFAFNSNVVVNARNFVDNIFWNARSNASGAGKNYATAAGGTAPNPTGLTSNRNDLYATGTGGFVGLFNGVDQTTLGNWQTATGQDTNSISADPLFVSPNGNSTTVDLHLQAGSPAISAGSAVTTTVANPLVGITNDFDGQTRNPSTPDVGADERTPYAPGAPVFVSAASRFTHAGGAGTFDVSMPSAGPSGVEPRSDGTTNFTLVMTFDQPIRSGNASVTSGTGSVSGVSFSGNSMLVALTGVTDQQVITVTAVNVTSMSDQTLPTASVNAGYLYADVNMDRVVNVGDTITTRSHAGQVLDNTNFQYDVNIDGQIDVGDTTVVRAKSGDFLP